MYRILVCIQILFGSNYNFGYISAIHRKCCAASYSIRAGRFRYAAVHLRSQGLPASAAPAGGGEARPAWQRRGGIYGTGRKINPEQYDKNTTQTGDDLCRICLGKRRKPLEMLNFCFLKTRGSRFTRRRSLVRVQQSPPKTPEIHQNFRCFYLALQCFWEHTPFALFSFSR